MNKVWQLLKKISSGDFAKTLTGIVVIVAGAGVSFIPAVGPVAAPYIMGAGAVMIGGGAIDKIVRKKEGQDAMAHEKALVAAVKTKMRGNNVSPID